MSRLALGALLLTGCVDTTPLAASCGGELVELCGPSEWAEISEASLSPERLPIDDATPRARVRVVLDRCPDAPMPHEVAVSALIPGAGAGTIRVLSLFTLTDGEDGDPIAGDGVIEAEIPNPLVSPVPSEASITLRYVARSTTIGGCSSGSFEQTYLTGEEAPEP